jgi:hypothetical protein
MDNQGWLDNEIAHGKTDYSARDEQNMSIVRLDYGQKRGRLAHK